MDFWPGFLALDKTGRDGRTEIQFCSTTGTEKYSFAVLLGRMISNVVCSLYCYVLCFSLMFFVVHWLSYIFVLKPITNLPLFLGETSDLGF